MVGNNNNIAIILRRLKGWQDVMEEKPLVLLTGLPAHGWHMAGNMVCQQGMLSDITFRGKPERCHATLAIARKIYGFTTEFLVIPRTM